ncbi:MAG: class II aldolase/adducin family protein [Gammaproteobacteria bacterium]|nr:class II aldolase/adducin family protein [Gammaproteobacteria bacterium]
MIESEGVIKYRLEFEHAGATDEDLQELNVWRSILYNLGLIGQHPELYGGYAYGNVSQRSRSNPEHFIISASQTGQIPDLEQQHYVTVESTDIEHNLLHARGPLQPSSEALTHAAIYRLNPGIRCVLHAHEPKLWHYGLQHGLPSTDPSIAYGTPEMADAILQLYRSGQLDQQQVLVMAGHQDGVISFGNTIDDAGCAMLDLWMQAQMELLAAD